MPPAGNSTGFGLGKGGAKRHRKVLRDNLRGITKPAIRRLARRGGVKRMSMAIYDDVRAVLKNRLRDILGQIEVILNYTEKKTVTTKVIVLVLRNMGSTIYGFDDEAAARRSRR